jgi:hypothetical protein
MKTTRKANLPVLAIFAITLAQASPGNAASVRPDTGFTNNILQRNDDGSTGAVSIGLSANFFGTTYQSAFVNNNGNLTFDSALATFTPFDLLSTSRAILAPFFADVDTRGAGSNVVTYGNSSIDGRAAFGVNWINVGYFSQRTDLLNSFQLVLIDRSDIAAGDFDFEFNYDKIEWETGGASGGLNGLGGSSARAGWSNGATASYELAGSAVNGAFLDGGPNALIGGSFNSRTQGRYTFSVRNGTVTNPNPASVPDSGSTALCFGLALGCLGGIRRLLGSK